LANCQLALHESVGVRALQIRSVATPDRTQDPRILVRATNLY
jgi:hypothetical protein